MDAWLRLLHETPRFNASFAPWLALLPRPGELLLPATMSEEEVAMLQGGPMVSFFSLASQGLSRNFTPVSNKHSFPQVAAACRAAGPEQWGSADAAESTLDASILAICGMTLMPATGGHLPGGAAAHGAGARGGPCQRKHHHGAAPPVAGPVCARSDDSAPAAHCLLLGTVDSGPA